MREAAAGACGARRRRRRRGTWGGACGGPSPLSQRRPRQQVADPVCAAARPAGQGWAQGRPSGRGIVRPRQLPTDPHLRRRPPPLPCISVPGGGGAAGRGRQGGGGGGCGGGKSLGGGAAGSPSPSLPPFLPLLLTIPPTHPRSGPVCSQVPGGQLRSTPGGEHILEKEKASVGPGGY